MLAHTTLSALNLTDRQDPSLVSDLTCLHKYFLKEGYSATALYFRSLQYLAEAFLDKSLSPEERVEKAYYCKSFFVIWKGNVTNSTQFITWQTYKDIKCTCDGLVLYLITLQKRFKSATVTTYLLGSDANEQLYAWIRTGFFAGRRTNLDAILLAYGCEKRNVRSELALPDDETSYAHSRGRSVLQEEVPLPNETWKGNKEKIKEWFGKDITTQGIKNAMECGTKALIDDARELDLPFLKVSEDESVTQLHGADEQMDPAELLDDDLDTSSAAEAEILVESESATLVNTSTFGRMNIRSAETLLLNGGRTTFGARERAGRFYSDPYSVSSSEMMEYHTVKPCTCESLIRKGDIVTLPQLDKDKDGKLQFCKGNVRFICTSYRVPLNFYCPEHFSKRGTVNVWLFSSSRYVRCTVK